MTKKDYERIAAILSSCRNEKEHCHDYLIRQLSGYFKEENPRFDKERFILACGLREVYYEDFTS